jgi:hypothetical protein
MFQEIFSKTYLFDPNPPRESKLYVAFLVAFTLCILFGILLRVLKKGPWEIRSRYSRAFWIPGILGLLYLFGRYESLNWLGSRAFLLSVIAIFLVWQIKNTIWAIRFIPTHMNQSQTEEKYKQYLPKPKLKKK